MYAWMVSHCNMQYVCLNCLIICTGYCTDKPFNHMYCILHWQTIQAYVLHITLTSHSSILSAYYTDKLFNHTNCILQWQTIQSYVLDIALINHWSIRTAIYMNAWTNWHKKNWGTTLSDYRDCVLHTIY
jgi:hypothetical protein